MPASFVVTATDMASSMVTQTEVTVIMSVFTGIMHKLCRYAEPRIRDSENVLLTYCHACLVRPNFWQHYQQILRAV